MLGVPHVAVYNGSNALDEACAHSYELLLLDCRMPGMNGDEILRKLRENPTHASAAALAIATSAEFSAEQLSNLSAAGFIDVLQKPCSISDLRNVLHKHLPDLGSIAALTIHDTPSVYPLDDTQGLAAVGGDSNILRSLRHLLIKELLHLDTDLRSVCVLQDIASLNEQLHRLRASAGFCGAPGLHSAISHLQNAMNSSAGIKKQDLEVFLTTCESVRQALLDAP